MKKVLITGGTGLLGANLLLDFQNKFSLSSIQLEGRVNFPVEKQASLNLCNKEKTKQFVKELKPDAIVHTAALVNIDYCESHRDEAFKVNAEATANIAEAAEEAGAKMIFVSTDSVFNGKTGNYREEGSTNPANVYAESKLEGEKLALEKNSNCVVARTSIYGWNAQAKQSLSEWMYNGLKEGKEIKFFEDVFFSPILVNNFGRAIAEIIENEFTGVLNVAGSQRISKLEFGRTLADVFGFGKEKIVASSILGSELAAKRPLDASLNVEKAKKILETELLDAKAGLEEKKLLLEKGFVEKLRRGVDL